MNTSKSLNENSQAEETLLERVKRVWYDAPDANAGFAEIMKIIIERERVIASLYENGEVYTGKRGGGKL